jgi:hypothetical protein
MRLLVLLDLAGPPGQPTLVFGLSTAGGKLGALVGGVDEEDVLPFVRFAGAQEGRQSGQGERETYEASHGYSFRDEPAKGAF